MIDLAETTTSRIPTRTRRRHKLDKHYEQILSQLRCLESDKSDAPRGVGVMGLERGDGATSIAANLAIVAAEAGTGSVLLIDANPLHPSLHKIFGVTAEPGFQDVVAGKADPIECVHATRFEGLSIMPYGVTRKAPPATLAPATGKFPFADLFRKFDIVLVDLPAAGESGLGLALTKSLGGVLLVLEAERSRRSAALRLKRQLEHFGANILGVVLNKRRHHVPNWLYRAL